MLEVMPLSELNEKASATGNKEFEIEKALSSIKSIIGSTDVEFRSRSFILDRAREFGVEGIGWSELSHYASWKNGGGFGLQQIPTEFVDCAMDLAKLDIHTVIEIGVFRGATSYFLGAILKRAYNNLKYILVDIEDNLVDFDKFSDEIGFIKCIPSTSDDFVGQVFDLVFIDGDHSYEWSRRDYSNVGRFCKKAVVFHDIMAHEFDHLDGGTVRMWREFRQSNAREMKIVQYTHEAHEWMGLGMGVKST